MIAPILKQIFEALLKFSKTSAGKATIYTLARNGTRVIQSKVQEYYRTTYTKVTHETKEGKTVVERIDAGNYSINYPTNSSINQAQNMIKIINVNIGDKIISINSDGMEQYRVNYKEFKKLEEQLSGLNIDELDHDDINRILDCVNEHYASLCKSNESIVVKKDIEA